MKNVKINYQSKKCTKNELIVDVLDAIEDNDDDICT